MILFVVAICAGLIGFLAVGLYTMNMLRAKSTEQEIWERHNAEVDRITKRLFNKPAPPPPTPAANPPGYTEVTR